MLTVFLFNCILLVFDCYTILYLIKLQNLEFNELKIVKHAENFYVINKTYKNKSRYKFTNSLSSGTCFGFVSHLHAEYTIVVLTTRVGTLIVATI